MARPRKNIDPLAVFELARIGCSLEEMSNVLQCDATTLGRRFRREVERGQAEMKVSLRRKQFEVALQGNVAMLIFLGKALLGQSDKGRTASPSEMGAALAESLELLSVEEQNERFRELLAKAGHPLETPPRRADGSPSPGALKTQAQV